jgi:hypothetical protein
VLPQSLSLAPHSRARAEGQITAHGSIANSTEQYSQMLEATFCLQPPGDTLTRKSIYESILSGCIPVVFRSDAAYVEQLAFPDVVPYEEMYTAPRLTQRPHSPRHACRLT